MIYFDLWKQVPIKIDIKLRLSLVNVFLKFSKWHLYNKEGL